MLLEIYQIVGCDFGKYMELWQHLGKQAILLFALFKQLLVPGFDNLFKIYSIFFHQLDHVIDKVTRTKPEKCWLL